MPRVTLSQPIALGLLAVFLVIIALASFIILRATGRLTNKTFIPSPTETVTIAPTSNDTLIPTDTITLTPEPPLEYIVKTGDSCNSIASLYGSSVSVIVSLNDLNSDCTNLQIGQTIKLPHPITSTPPVAACHTLPGEAQAQTMIGSGIVSGEVLPFSPVLALAFPPAGGPVSGVITGEQPVMNGSETCMLTINGTVDGTFAGGDGGAVSGSIKVTYKVVCSAGSKTQRYSIPWQGTLTANGTGEGTWDSTVFGSGSWQVSYPAVDFQSICNPQ